MLFSTTPCVVGGEVSFVGTKPGKIGLLESIGFIKKERRFIYIDDFFWRLPTFFGDILIGVASPSLVCCKIFEVIFFLKLSAFWGRLLKRGRRQLLFGWNGRYKGGEDSVGKMGRWEFLCKFGDLDFIRSNFSISFCFNILVILDESQKLFNSLSLSIY